MKRNNYLLVIMILCYFPLDIVAQQTIILNIKTVTDKYSMRSTEALNAALRFKNQMLNDQNIRKEFFPTLAFTLSPFNFNRSLRTLQRPEDGSYSYVEDYSNSSSTGLSVSQKVPYVNGSFSVSSNLSLLSEFSNDRYSFSSTPYRLSYQQRILGEYKSYRWEQQINRLKRSKIAKDYTQQLSSIQEMASQLYLNLYACKRLLEYVQYQCISSDSLLKVARIRYQQGNILEKESLMLELQNSNQHLSLTEEQRNYSNALEDLLVFLNIEKESSSFDVEAPIEEVPLNIQSEDVLMKVQTFCPETESSMISDIEAEQTVYNARVGQWLNANVSLNYGTNQYGSTFLDAYRKPLSQQSVTIGLQIPLFDWGKGRNSVLIAKNEYQQTKNELKKKRKEKEISLRKEVEEYNYLVETMRMSKKSYELSQKNFELTLFELEHQRTTIDKLVEIEKIMKESFIRHINNLTSVWKQYYSIRSECLYDYIENKPLADIFQQQIINWK